MRRGGSLTAEQPEKTIWIVFRRINGRIEVAHRLDPSPNRFSETVSFCFSSRVLLNGRHFDGKV